jgi:CarD family transcriptional regulator
MEGICVEEETSVKTRESDFSLNDLVAYGASGVCRIVAIESRSFDGEHYSDYYKLQPDGDNRSCYYVPIEQASQRMRPLLTKEEVYSLIDNHMASCSDTSGEWCKDNRKRRSLFQAVLHSDNYPNLITMMHTLHQQQERCRKNGKKLSNADEAIMHAAEKRMFQEFSIVLNLQPDQVDGFIRQRLVEA